MPPLPPAAAVRETACTDQTVRALAADGYALISSVDLGSLLGLELPALDALRDFWNNLRPDEYLRDGGRYRARRHSCFVESFDVRSAVGSAEVTRSLMQSPHRAHWQPTTYNALHGGMERRFAPMDPAAAESAVFQQMVAGFGAVFARIRSVENWFIEAHQFRIDTAHGIGRPTPEGAHRDGVDFVVVVLVDRVQVRGGETRVFQNEGNTGVRFTMQKPWSALLMDDARVVHETTPIQPLQEGTNGYRDTLVLTYRERGFQAPG